VKKPKNKKEREVTSFFSYKISCPFTYKGEQDGTITA
jgi:hypothetical protein